MDLDERISKLKEEINIVPDEKDIRKTIEASRAGFIREEEKWTLPYHLFLYDQFRLIRKRWWMLQIFVLAALWAVLPAAEDIFYSMRSFGVGAALFIILIIPELWKNQTSLSMEIESAAYYSLRQIYAARMLLFGIADTVMLTVFCTMVSFSMQISFADLLIQFLFPLTVTAGICFAVLSGKQGFSESAAVGLCVIWSALWWFILLDEQIYTAISLPVWAALFGAAVLFLGFCIYRTLWQCGQIWESSMDMTETI